MPASRFSSLTAVSLIVLAACAAAPQTDTAGPDAAALQPAQSGTVDPRRGEPVDRVCFVDSINGFTETTRTSVVIEARVNDEYLIETFGNCFDLDDALTIGFDTFGGSGCLRRGDAIIASDSAFGLHDGFGIAPQRYTIRAIYGWNPEAGAEAKGAGAETGSEPAAASATEAATGTGS